MARSAASSGSARSRKATSTSNFGVSRRESHDASAFYARFEPPEFDDSNDIAWATQRNVIHPTDASDMRNLPDNSVALVVTSPPYFAGKAYEEDMSRGEVPSTYVEYLGMLRTVFAECKRVLEPGGRIAVNVANLGRRPYRSLSADVIGILQDDLRLWLRGEIIWEKAKGATGSTAWGSFQRAGNPVLRDLTERVIVASKGRLDRALPVRQREQQGKPSVSTMYRDEFLDYTTDIWEFGAESATRVGHPAPFPVELPNRLIQLYTYEDDLVLDPFMGSGTTAVAAMRNGRDYVGYELDRAYIATAEERIAQERDRLESKRSSDRPRPRLTSAPVSKGPSDLENFQSRATSEGKRAQALAEELLSLVGFTDIDPDVKLSCGIQVNFSALDRNGRRWYFDVTGAFTSSQPGLKRTDTLWKCIGRASVLAAAQAEAAERVPLMLLTTDKPARNSSGSTALKHVTGPGLPILDVIEILDPAGQDRLAEYAENGFPSADTSD
jgi:site-specific DNA-methyltransferase (adenine-specific)